MKTLSLTILPKGSGCEESHVYASEYVDMNSLISPCYTDGSMLYMLFFNLHCPLLLHCPVYIGQMSWLKEKY